MVLQEIVEHQVLVELVELMVLQVQQVQQELVLYLEPQVQAVLRVLMVQTEQQV